MHDDAPNALPGRLGEQTLFLLAARPGDESVRMGELIARACARGRSPYVAILADGSRTNPAGLPLDAAALAARHERETRAAAAALGLDGERLLFVRIHETTVPTEGALFDALVKAVALATWARDCGIVVAPAAGSAHPDDRAAAAIAGAAAAATGIGHVAFGGTGDLVLPTASMAKRRAVAAHALLVEPIVAERFAAVPP